MSLSEHPAKPYAAHLRERLGWSQKDFASFLNVTYRTLRRWENGQAPTGTAASVLDAFREVEYSCTVAGEDWGRFATILKRSIPMGGLRYLLVYLLNTEVI